MDTGDLDLAVELLLTWPLLGIPLGHTPAYVLAHVLETEERLGFPSRDCSSAENNAGPGRRSQNHPPRRVDVYPPLLQENHVPTPPPPPGVGPPAQRPLERPAPPPPPIASRARSLPARGPPRGAPPHSRSARGTHTTTTSRPAAC